MYWEKLSKKWLIAIIIIWIIILWTFLLIKLIWIKNEATEKLNDLKDTSIIPGPTNVDDAKNSEIKYDFEYSVFHDWNAQEEEDNEYKDLDLTSNYSSEE